MSQTDSVLLACNVIRRIPKPQLQRMSNLYRIGSTGEVAVRSMGIERIACAQRQKKLNDYTQRLLRGSGSAVPSSRTPGIR